MSETNTAKKNPVISFWKGFKAEFKKIIWPDAKTLTNKTLIVVGYSIFVGILIAIVDFVYNAGLTFIIK